MKKAEKKTLRGKKISELEVTLAKKKTELIKEVAELKSGKSSNPKNKRSLKRDISQISTIIREKELQERTKDKEQSTKKGQKAADKKK